MTSPPIRVFVGRLSGLPVFDPAGDQVGRVRDLVVLMRPGRPPRVLGLVVEVFGRRSVFVPMSRVTTVDSGQVITTGLLNLRRFEQRSSETLVMGQLLDRKVSVRETGAVGTVYDVAIEQERNRDWVIVKVFVRKGLTQAAPRMRGDAHCARPSHSVPLGAQMVTVQNGGPVGRSH